MEDPMFHRLASSLALVMLVSACGDPDGPDSGQGLLGLSAMDGQTTAFGHFHAADAEDAPCVETVVAGCKRTSCGDMTPVANLDGLIAKGGKVRFEGGTRPVEINSDALGVASGYWDEQLFSGGEAIRILATSFEGVPEIDTVLEAPMQAELTLASTDIRVAAGADVPLSWTGGAPGTLLVFTATAGDEQSSESLTCEFDAASGGATVAGAALEGLAPYGMAGWSASTARIELQEISDWSVSVSVQQSAIASEGVAAFGVLELE